ncbi:MAG TPA: hypothetical protein VGM25_03115 [Caulobacteraceae bacterium]|jgi:hypothetical protein
MCKAASLSSIVICCSLAVAACQPAGPPLDWRVQQTEAAEAKIRAEVGDPGAQFAKVQVTGDDKTGQICGEVQPAHNGARRFVVYIDGTAGPWVEQGAGHTPVSQDRFDQAWQNDCLNEGYAQ